MFPKAISVVLLVYNEEKNIRDVITAVLNTMPSITQDFEIIAVDDGSNDGTLDILEDLKSADAHLKIVRHTKNRGYGAALVSGFRSAAKELIFMMDADRQFDILEIKQLTPYIIDYDMVIGFRAKRQDPYYRCLLGRCFNFIMRIMFRINVKDVDCGFKLFKRDFLRNLDFVTRGLMINTEIIALACKNKLKIKEIGVSHYPRIYGRQSGASPKTIFRIPLDTLVLKWHFLKSEK